MLDNHTPEDLRQTAQSTMRTLGMEPDPWQLDVLAGNDKSLLLNCCRQAGKSTTVALLSVLVTVGRAFTTVLIVAPSLRQSRLLFKTAAKTLSRLGHRYIARKTAHELQLKNESQKMGIQVRILVPQLLLALCEGQHLHLMLG